MNDLVMREIMNGTMFVLASLLAMTMGFRLWQRIGTPQWHEEGTQAVIAIFIFMIAEVIRSGWVWIALTCQNAHGRGGCSIILSSYEVLAIATAFAVIGKTCCIRVFSPHHWRPWSWVGAGVAAVTIPLVVHFT